MARQVVFPLLFVLLLTGCQSIDGTYRPGCVAYEGDEIRLARGEFTWDRFTDQVRVDADGNVIDPFPGYPRKGFYRVDGDRLLLEAAGGSSSEVFFLLRDDGRLRLLNESQHRAFARAGEVDACALVRDETGSD